MARKQLSKSEMEMLLTESFNEGEAEVAWLTTLGDLMMLLLTFFVMLLAISDFDPGKLTEALEEMGKALKGKEAKIEQVKDPLEDTKKYLEAVVRDSNLQRDIEMTSDTRGLVLYSRGDFFFKSGTAEILPDTKLFLKKVAKVLAQYNTSVLIEGHTDDVPISTAIFPSNWELSTGRAAAVVRYFVEEHKLDPKRFIVAGYAEYKPRFAVTPENRPRNRRVEIIIMRNPEL